MSINLGGIIMISYYHEDIFTADETFICHQVNCKGVMGAGLAKQIADKYPLVKERYLEMCKNYTPHCNTDMPA